MNERFKFRVWDVSANAYVPRSQFVLLSDGTLIQEIGGESVICESTFPEMCTGLKDKNGKLIYEGDIIEKQNQKFVIKYEFDSFVAYSEEKKPVSIYGLFTFKLCFGGWPEKETENTIEVIGNIHENPELVKWL